jgi:hypothetical protein
MNVEIGAEAALFPEKEYISGMSLTLSRLCYSHFRRQYSHVLDYDVYIVLLHPLVTDTRVQHTPFPLSTDT